LKSKFVIGQKIAAKYRYFHFSMNILRWLIYFFRVLFFYKKKTSTIVFALPKSGSTVLEYVTMKALHLPPYIPISGIIADIKTGKSHNCYISEFDLWIIRNFGVFVKTHLRVKKSSFMKLKNNKIRILGLALEVNNSSKSFINHIKRHPSHKLHKSNYGEEIQNAVKDFTEWKKHHSSLFQVFNINSDLDSILMNLSISKDKFDLLSNEVINKYPDHFSSLK